MKILAIGAHFDDIELGCGGTLLKHQERGDEIYLLVVTHSEYSSTIKGYTRKKDIARAEGEKSASLLGAHLICLNEAPLVLFPTEKLATRIEDVVNEIKPDRVYTHQSNDSHSDHAAVGYASIRACRKCDEVLCYRSNWYIMDNITENDNYYVDISDFINKKITLLNTFESEMEMINSWLDFVKSQNRASGAKVGVDYTETFKLIKMFWR